MRLIKGLFRIDVMEKVGEWLEENHPHGINQYSGGTVVQPPVMPVSKNESSNSRAVYHPSSKASNQYMVATNGVASKGNDYTFAGQHDLPAKVLGHTSGPSTMPVSY